jgi:hypothetical protein
MNRAFTFVLSLLMIASPLAASAQNSETIGVRAQGMAGAFTAIADDASATWWNPAGLAAGPFFNLVLETSSQHQPADETAVPAWSGTSRGFAMTYPALGLSYYRLRGSEIRAWPAASTAPGAGGRQDTGAENVRLRSQILNQFGLTVGQSLGAHLVVASTLKLLRAGAAVDIQDRGAAGLATAESLSLDSDTRTGLDVGALAKFGGMTLGVMVRNATEPTFGEGDSGLTLARHVRAGIGGRSAGGRGRVTVGADVDITDVVGVFGEERRFSAGAEFWTRSQALGVRGGVSGNTLGSVKLTPSGGVSLAFRQGMYVDAYVTVGADEIRRGWGSGLRVTF